MNKNWLFYPADGVFRVVGITAIVAKLLPCSRRHCHAAATSAALPPPLPR
jgi:hypothetical protein